MALDTVKLAAVRSDEWDFSKVLAEFSKIAPSSRFKTAEPILRSKSQAVRRLGLRLLTETESPPEALTGALEIGAKVENVSSIRYWVDLTLPLLGPPALFRFIRQFIRKDLRMGGMMIYWACWHLRDPDPATKADLLDLIAEAKGLGFRFENDPVPVYRKW